MDLGVACSSLPLSLHGGSKCTTSYSDPRLLKWKYLTSQFINVPYFHLNLSSLYHPFSSVSSSTSPPSPSPSSTSPPPPPSSTSPPPPPSSTSPPPPPSSSTSSSSPSSPPSSSPCSLSSSSIISFSSSSSAASSFLSFLSPLLSFPSSSLSSSI